MKIKRPFSCGLGPMFDMVGGRWKAAILWELSQHGYRFSELKRSLNGITEKMLMQQLRELELHGLITRKDYGEFPRRVEYRLTHEGERVNKILLPLADWGKEYSEQLGIADNYLKDAR